MSVIHEEVDSKIDQFRYQLEFKLTHTDGSYKSDEGTASFRESALVIEGASGQPLSIPLRDITEFEGKNYRVLIALGSGELLELYYLGHNYENFLESLTSARNEVIKHDLLMHESLLFVAEDLEYGYFDGHDQLIASGASNAQVSDTALILATPDGNHLKFPLSYVSSVEDRDYAINILMDNRERIILKMLGRQREPLLLNLEGAINRLEEKAAALCESLFGPSINSCKNELAILFKDGRAVSKKRLDAFSSGLWPEMEHRLDSCGLVASYLFLSSFGDEENSAIGFKRGLMGDLTGEYVWFLIPIKGRRLIAMESGKTSLEGGQATYFFKCPEEAELEAFIHNINYCLFMVNFRREPVYLTDEQLQKPAYKEYTFAVERLPELRLLRKLFIGRVIHTTEEQWKRKIEEICGKNMDRI